MLYSIRMRASDGEMHISGAEGIFGEKDIHNQAAFFIQRALNHSRGTPESITISIDRINTKPISIKSLPLCTCRVNGESDAGRAIMAFLSHLGIKELIIKKALGIMNRKDQMRGAALVNMKTGKRLEKDRFRGIRVSRLGITSEASKTLSERLNSLGVENRRVKEAFILASKVASCPGIQAELCISDNPDYTTGYVASRRLGYVRIPFIKDEGSLNGGRVFFVKNGVDIDRLIHYLEHVPVMIKDILPCWGLKDVDEIISTLHYSHRAHRGLRENK